MSKCKNNTNDFFANKELIHKYVSSVKTIGGYARIDNFYDKTEEQLRNMA